MKQILYFDLIQLVMYEMEKKKNTIMHGQIILP